MRGTVRLANLHEQHKDEVEFLLVYIREAHPTDGWWLGGGVPGLAMKMSRLKAATDVADPKTMVERTAVAARCANELNYGIRTLVDGMDDAVNNAYAGWPTRLYLVGVDGRIEYAGGPGPFGFKPTALGRAIAATISEQ